MNTSTRQASRRRAARATVSPLAVTLCSALLAGCASIGHYRAPEIGVPAAYPSDPRAAGADAPEHYISGAGASDERADPWWQAFGDPRLGAFVDDVFQRNNDLMAAALRVRRAQLAAGLAADALLPQIGGSASAGYSRELDGDGDGMRTHSANFSVRYEVDLWGRLRTQRDAARLEVDATREDREAATLALAGTAISLYANLGFLNQRIAAAEASLERVERTRELVDVQYRAGAVSGVELRESAQALLGQQAELSALVQQRVEVRNAIAVLRDGQRWPETDEPQDLDAIAQPPLPAAVPAELLGRRPDLRAAELRLRQAFANVDITRTRYYPTFSLSAGAGGSSSELIDVLRDPVGSLGAALALPLLGWNAMRIEVQAAKVDLEIAIATFRQTLRQAFAEVDDALSARTTLAEQYAARSAALAEAVEIERLYEVRYRAGAAPLRVWLDAQESRRSAGIALAQLRLAQLQNDVLLYQALGGRM
jgi:NodT family efflux transporter outer membrane factor (OMF) lipoprotein